MKYLFLIFIVLLMPYNIFPQSMCGALLSITACILLINNKVKIKVNKFIFLNLLFISVLSIISFLFSKNINLFFDGFFTYIAVLLFYMVFINNDSEKLLNYFSYVISASTVFFIIFQGIIIGKRIDGNISYANTYGLVLLICLYMNEIRQKDKFYFIVNWISILGILFTGSRNTFVYFIIFFIICFFTKLKRREENIIIINTFTVGILYILYEYFGMGMLFIMPAFYIVLYYIYGKMSSNIKKYLDIIFVVLMFTAFILPFFKGKCINEKINIISINPGTIQERMVYYEDTLSHILKNPLGSGINTFVYKQYNDQSAFYDVKYIHNSVLQVFYDIGTFGALSFVAIFFYIIYSIFKFSSGKDKIFKIALFTTIYFHSLLDFDFSFLTIGVIAIMVVSLFCKKTDFKISRVFQKVLVYFMLIISLYVCTMNVFSMLGDAYLERDVDKSIYFYNLNRAVTIKNPDVYIFIAQSYNKKHMTEKCLENLKIAERINPEDPRIKTDIAFTYEKLGDIENTIKYYDSVLKIQKYYPEIYKKYYIYLDNVYKDTGDYKYKIKMNNLKRIYYKNYKSLNKKSIFLKGQMSGDFFKDISGKF